MAPTVAVGLFVVSTSATLWAARAFARRLDRLGVQFGFPEALVGLLTALAADGPELSSALFALAKGKHAVSVGVLVGSNAFNLAAMIGLSGLLTGAVRLSRDTLFLEGAVGVVVTLVGVGVLGGWLGPVPAASVSALVFAAYLAVLVGGVSLLKRRDRSGGRVSSALARVLDQRTSEQRRTDAAGSPPHRLLGFILLDVALIVAGSAGMVQAVLTLGGRWHISTAILGTLILAPLTSLPNAATAVRLGLAGRGAALVGETFNSNTINLLAGVIAPALFVAVATVSHAGKLQLAWLLAMTLACVFALAKERGMARPEAAAIVMLYVSFVALQFL